MLLAKEKKSKKNKDRILNIENESIFRAIPVKIQSSTKHYVVVYHVRCSYACVSTHCLAVLFVSDPAKQAKVELTCTRGVRGSEHHPMRNR